MRSIRIGREFEHVTISVEDPQSVRESGAPRDSNDYYEANWVNAEIKIAAGGFSGTYRAHLFRTDFRDFYKDLTNLYSFGSHQGEFRTFEDQLRLEISGDGRGNFESSCVAKDASGNYLNFTVSFDQTDIPRMLKELDRIIEAYPVIGRPDE